MAAASLLVTRTPQISQAIIRPDYATGPRLSAQLAALEGLAEGLFKTIAAEIAQEAPALTETFKPVMKKIYAKHDWQEYGGAPLLGVGGYCLICHGRSDARAIKNAIRVGRQLVKSGVNQKIVEEIAVSIPGGED